MSRELTCRGVDAPCSAEAGGRGKHPFLLIGSFVAQRLGVGHFLPALVFLTAVSACSSHTVEKSGPSDCLWRLCKGKQVGLMAIFFGTPCSLDMSGAVRK